jgi:Big-like domain-containing protein
VGSPPYRFQVPIPKTIVPGPYRLTAAGTSPSQGKNPIPVESKPITIVVERADEPVRLEVYPPTMRLQVGIKGYLSVTGVFADGQQVDLKESSKTIYTSDTPGVVTVDPKSFVNPLAPGSAKITVSNGKVKVEVPVVVSAAKSP